MEKILFIVGITANNIHFYQNDWAEDSSADGW